MLVLEWVKDHQFSGKKAKHQPYDMLPKALYLPDGRSVPVCVVKVSPVEVAPPPVPSWHWPDSLMGPGLPINVKVQAETRMATAGCLVSDGHTTYALTNRHVCGPPGTPITATIRNSQIPVGRSSDKQLTRMLFSEIYPALPLRATYSNLDIGLIELDRLSDWTSQVYGLGPIGALADLGDHNLSLRLIGQRVVAHGAYSGELAGRIQALFYRYKTVGGYEYVSDFLIAPDHDSVSTQPGDSGAVWHLAPTKEGDLPLPLAVEWAGQAFAFPTGASRLNFALATTLSNVCRLLDVELVQEHNTGVAPFWGQTGHYSIASFACDLLGQGKLGKLMDANLDRISFARGKLTSKDIKEALKEARDNDTMVPLADVPDLVWKHFPGSITGGRDDKSLGPGKSTGPEHPNHYADADEQRPSDGKSLLALTLADPAKNLTVKFWQAFYNECGHLSSAPTKRGLLPFRVWQFFDAMVTAAKQKNVTDYVCAAGLLAHYVGDACQPLHGSIYADGFPGQTSPRLGEGVHSLYETTMIDRYAPDLVPAISQKVKKQASLAPVASGFEAALSIVKLMDRSAKKLPPKKLVKAYVDAGGTPHAKERDALWAKYSDETAALMADGARVLAMLWESAWAAGKGNAIPTTDIKQISASKLKQRYEDTSFVPSLTLDQIGPVLK